MAKVSRYAGFRAPLLIIFALLVSGCAASNTTINANNGLIVNDFSVDPVQVEADDAVRFFLDAENVGGTTARCVTTELFGVDNWYDEYGQPLSHLTAPVTRGLGFSLLNGVLNLCYTDVTRGYLCVGYNTNNDDFAVSGGLFGGFSDFFLGYSNEVCSSLLTTDPQLKLIKHQPELLPPNPALGRAGQSFTTEWILYPPVLPEGVTATYPITARTSYFYLTNAHMNIQAFSKNEFKRRADLGQVTDYPLVVENTFGAPIQIFATRGSSPIVVNPESFSGPAQIESYRFEFANLGEGFTLPIAGPDTQDGFIFAMMTISGPGAYFYDCLGQSGQQVLLPGNTLRNLVKLRSDQRVPVSCSIGIDRTQWIDKPVGTISITFELGYRYYTDRTVDVRVVGVEGLSRFREPVF